MGSLLDDLRAFRIQTDQWTIVAQDADESYRTVKHGEELLGLHYGIQ